MTWRGRKAVLAASLVAAAALAAGAPAAAPAATGSVALPSSMSIGTGSWNSLSATGTTPSAADLTGPLRAIVVGTNATVKIDNTTGLTQPTGYTNWTTGASEIAFTGSLADINTALATLSVKGAATGAGSVGVYVVPNDCGTYNPGTGHYYKFTSAVVGDYASARAYARGLSCNGLGGYLAAIENSSEMSFQVNKVSNGDGMLGGRKWGGSWTWFDGPAGLSGTPVTYFAGSWCSGEPNNYGGNEVIIWHTYRGCWNDTPENTSGTTYSQPMYVEYGGITGQAPTQEATGTISLAVDGTPPTASWSTVPSTPSNANPLSYTLTFSEAISGLTSSDFTNSGTATGCTFTPASSSGTVINVSVSGCSSTGTVIANLAANSVSDSLGNLGPTALLAASSVTIDRTAPTVTWGSAPSSPTNASSLTFPITFSETASGIAAGDFSNAGTSTGCTFAPSAASGTSVNVVVTGCSEGTVVPRIAAGSVSDAAGNTAPGTALDANSVTIDRLKPTASWGTAPPTPTNASSITWALNFSESVTGIAAADFTNDGSATGCTFTPSVSSGASINVVATGCSSGSIIPRLTVNSVTDLSGNTGPAVASTGQTVVRDAVVPTVTWGTPPSTPNNSATLTFPITFSEAVSGIAASDFTNVGSAVGCVFTPSAATGTSINLVVSGCGAGTVQPRLAANSVTDTAGNNGPAVISDGSSITVDRTAPTVTWGATPTSPTNSASITFPITFSETVVGVAAGDFTNAGTATGCSFAPSAATGTSINIVVNGCGTGTLIPRLAAGGVSDAAGNTAPPTALNAGTVTVDRTPATATWTSSPSTPTSSATLVWGLSFSETVSGIAAVDFSNAGTATGCIFTPSAPMAASINLTVSNCSNGTVIPVLAAGGVLDPVNNASPASASTAPGVTRDSTAPTVSSVSTPAANASPGDLVYTFTFSEEISGLTSADFSNASSATGCTFTPASSTGTVITVTASGCSYGGVAIRLTSGSVADLAGNSGPATAYTGSTVRNGTRSQPNFKINSLGATPFTLRTDAMPYTGDDRGGMAISDQKVFLTGDASIGRWNLSDLGSPVIAATRAGNEWMDGLVSDLRARKAYSFDGPSYASGSGVNGTITGLTQLDPATGLPTSTKITLSEPIPATSGALGVFSGYGRVVIWAQGSNRVYDIEMPSGIVDDLGARAAPGARVSSEAPGTTSWGTAEYFDGQLYLDYVESSTRIARMKVSDGTVTWLASGFTGLSDMASFTVDPSTNRWYFHFEGASTTFPGNTDEAIGYSVASFTTGPGATWGSTPSSPNNGSTLTFPLEFTGSVSGVTSGDFSNTGTAAGCSIAPSASSGTSINVVVTGCSEGTVKLRLATDSVTDANGNTGPSGTTDSGSVTIDRTAPAATWGSPPSSPNNSTSLTFPITFDEPVSGLAAGDFANAGNATGCSFTPSAASGTSINVVVTGCSEGTVQPRLASGSVTDTAGNSGPGSAATASPVTVDRSIPTAAWASPPTSPTNSSSITFAVSFGESVTGLAAGDFSNAGTATGCSFAPGASSGTLISVVVTGCSEGTLVPVLQAGAITDLAGNAGPGVPVTSTAVTIDRTAPTAAFTSVPASPTSGNSFTWALAFSETVYGISAGDFTNAGTATGCQFTVSASAGTSVNVTATGCSEGTVELRLAAGAVTDGANSGPASATTASSVNVDRTAPVAPTASGLSSGATASTSASVTLSGGEPGLTYECSLDGAAWSACSSPVSLTGLAEGGHSFRVRSTDPAGNTSPVTTRNWEVDLTPPNLAPTATGMPTGTTSSTSLNPTISGEPGNTLQCRLDGGSWTPCSSLLPVSGLADATHTLEARQQDAAGNIGPIASWVWAVDTAPPANPPTSGGGPSTTSDPTPTFTFTGDAGNTFQCRVDGGSWAPCTSPFTTPALPDGTHTIDIRQVDGAGNAGPIQSIPVTVDTTAPAEVGVSGIPASPTNSQSASLTLTGEPGSTVECKVDGGSWQSPCPSPLSLSGLAEGDHVVVTRQRDGANNLSATTTVRWTVDRTAPSYAPGVVDRPDLETNATSAGFDLAAVAPDTLECRLDGGAWGPCPSPLQYTGLGDGDHTLEARAVDQAGNAGPVSTVNWTIDRTAPANQPSILGAPSGTVAENSAAFSFGVDPGTTAQCSLDGASWQSCVSPLSLTGLADGAHSLRIRLADPAGNTGPEATSSWTVDTTGPDAPAVTGAPTGATSSTSLSASFTGEPGGAFECQLDGGGWASCTSPFTETGLADGPHVFKVRQTDSLGNTGTARTVSWTVDATAPASAPSIGSGPADGSSTSDATPTFEFSGAPAGESYQCRVDDGTWTACTSPFTLPSLETGEHSFDVRLIDAAGNTGPANRRTFTVTDPPAQGPGAQNPPASTPADGDRPRLVDSTPAVSSEGEVQTRVACDSPGPCRVTLAVIVGGVPVAAGDGTIPAGQVGTVPIQLPETMQARLAREGSITITVRTVIEVEGSRVETETTLRITAPPAREARNWKVKPSPNGDAQFTATCEGTLSSRCDGTLTLYDAATLDSGTASAAASTKVVVATAKLAGPSGKPIVVTAKLNAEGKKRLRKKGYLKIKPLVQFTGATASRQPDPYRINAMTTARWIRAAVRAVESGGDVRSDLNKLLDRAKSGSVGFRQAARTMTGNIIPRRERTLRAVRALPREPSKVRGARSLALCSMSRSLDANHEYLRWFTSGNYRHYVRGSVHSYRASICKDRFLARVRTAGAKVGVRVPYPTGLWP